MSYVAIEERAMKPKTLEERMLKRISRKRGDAFLRADFEDLGGYDQVGRLLRKMVRESRLVRVGQGLYVRASSSITSGKPIPARGLAALREALGRVGIATFPTRLERDYNAGKTTQVPTGRVVGLTRRVRRKVGYGGLHLSFERAGPERRARTVD
jgi:Family of unknown function (DUF6088)